MAKLSQAFYLYTNQTYELEYYPTSPAQARCRLMNRTAECAPSDQATAPEFVDAIINEGIMPNSAYTKYLDLQLYPIMAQAVVAVYNIPGVRNLTILANTLGTIYRALDPPDESSTGLYRWNNSVITTSNPGFANELRAAGVKGRIVRFVRSDVSSTSETFRWAITASDVTADVSI
jgi:hypothetical protein